MLGNAATTVQGIRDGLAKHRPVRWKSSGYIGRGGGIRSSTNGTIRSLRSKKKQGSDFCSRVGPRAKYFVATAMHIINLLESADFQSVRSVLVHTSSTFRSVQKKLGLVADS